MSASLGHVFAFALFAHQDKSSANPVNVDQWRFHQ
jgi:hypothetical protein